MVLEKNHTYSLWWKTVGFFLSFHAEQSVNEIKNSTFYSKWKVYIIASFLVAFEKSEESFYKINKVYI